MIQDAIVVTGAREHNLKNVSVSIPKNTLTVFTGVSGSGKSSLAFDTIFIEGQRKYLESLSSYARQFFGQLKKPDVDRIDGLSPSISIEQKTTSHNPRSTVGTMTEIYDYLRLLYASASTPYCPECGDPIQHLTIDEIVEAITRDHENDKAIVLASVVRGKKGEFKNVIELARKEGFLRIRVDGVDYHLDEKVVVDKHQKHNIEIIIDRMAIKSENRKRLFESVQMALKHGNGTLQLDVEGTIKFYSSNFACPKCDVYLPDINPGLFSFNSPFGACEYCKGLGDSKDFIIEKVMPTLTVSIKYWLSYLGLIFDRPYVKALEAHLKRLGMTTDNLLKDLSQEQIDLIFHGDKDTLVGMIDRLRNWYANAKSDYRRRTLEKFMEQTTCPVCKGKRLKKEVLAMKIEGKDIIELTEMSIIELYQFMEHVELTPRQQEICKQVLQELRGRLNFMVEIGLDYLTLARQAGSLSGGESQRLRLATQMGFGLSGVLYVLDEPTIGLHPRDTARLIEAMKRLRDLGNTLIVVEHDRDVMAAADHIVEIGPGAGKHGGHICYAGAADQFQYASCVTSDYLTGKKVVAVPAASPRVQENFITIEGAHRHNLQNVSVKFPTGNLIGVTGVSGSGKSTLIFDVFYKAIQKVHWGRVQTVTDRSGDAFKQITGLEHLDKVIVIDQSPIGRTPRSNPATYTGMFDGIRNLFVQTVESKRLGYKAGQFSFNVASGRCEACHGDGSIKIEMLFLPDVYIPCEVCKGKRYNSQTLEVTYKGFNISDVLAMTIEEAAELFRHIPQIIKFLDVLLEVGLGYMTLGQSSTTLSGGEAQRIKLATELSRVATGRTLYILDEPTTGLHFADVQLLLKVLQTLVDRGNTVLVIEHNTDVIRSADWIIDLGPEGGNRGGQLVAQGPLDIIRKAKKSFTGKLV